MHLATNANTHNQPFGSGRGEEVSAAEAPAGKAARCTLKVSSREVWIDGETLMQPPPSC